MRIFQSSICMALCIVTKQKMYQEKMQKNVKVTLWLISIACTFTSTKPNGKFTKHHHMHIAHILLLQTSKIDRPTDRHWTIFRRRWLWDSKPCFWDQNVYTTDNIHAHTYTFPSNTLLYGHAEVERERASEIERAGRVKAAAIVKSAECQELAALNI